MRERPRRRSRRHSSAVLPGTLLILGCMLLCCGVGQVALMFVFPLRAGTVSHSPSVASVPLSGTAGALHGLWASAVAPAAAVGMLIVVGVVARRAGMRLFSPAKVNTFLKITGRTSPPNPMHTMVSQFHTINLGDWMRISTTDAEKDSLRCDDPSVPTDEGNLIIKALEVFRRKSGSKQHFDVTLTKRCPNQAGLGGGSSNGATALWAANRLTRFGAADDTLAEWSRELGSDLPFFLASKGAALCSGIGDEVFPMTPEAVGGHGGMVFVKPSFGLPTPAVYKEYAKSDGQAPQPLNDLTRGAVELRPELLNIAKDMEDVMGLTGVSMSGSGSCLFGYGKPERLEDFKAEYPGTMVWSDVVPVFRESGQWYNYDNDDALVSAV